MNLPIKILSLAAILATTFTAKADTLDFTLIGGGNTFTFSLPSNPSPDSDTLGTQFVLSSILITEDPGTPGSIAFSTDLTFSNSSVGGGVAFPLPSIPPISVDLNLSGPQLYTGTEDAPMFSPTTTPLVLDEAKSGDSFTLDITDASPVPEPSSIAMFGSGLLALAGVARMKFLAR